MTRRSEEGDLEGLGWIDAETVQFNLSEKYKIPHIGGIMYQKKILINF